MIVSGADKVWLSFWFYEITTIPDEKIKKTHPVKTHPVTLKTPAKLPISLWTDLRKYSTIL